MNQIKHEGFDQFWGLVEQLGLNVRGYSKQTIFAFNKLAELSFDKGKPHNSSLITEIRAILSILKYDAEPEVDIITGIFQIEILLKRSKFLIISHTDQQLLQEIETSIKEKDARKRFSSQVQSFSNIFKR